MFALSKRMKFMTIWYIAVGRTSWLLEELKMACAV
jgi:hypothetical protein